MKKFFTFILSLITALSAAATTFTFTSSNDVSQTKDGITVTLAKAGGNNDPFFSSSEEMRLYAKNTITVSGASLNDISLTFAKQGSKDYASITASPGSLSSGGNSTSATDYKTDKWTGSASTVTFTLGANGQRILVQIVVNGTGNEETPSNPNNPGDGNDSDQPSNLDPNYKYSEPTVVTGPSKTVQGDAYWFINNNVQISCTKGAITDKYFSAHAGFDMTFTATQPIKGIVINGFVKKDFEATVDKGKISFISPLEDIEADPVVVITDIDSKTVTISCVKQLRCYSVKIYFEANPDETISGGGSSSTVDVTYDAADAVYESEFVEFFGEENYSIFLYNTDKPDFPYIALDIYPTTDDLTGTYTMSDYSLGDYTYYVYGAGEDDYYWALDGEAQISVKDEIYTITGYIVCENNVRYNFTFTGEMPMYLDTDYYYGDENSVKDIVIDNDNKLNPDAPMYNLQGQRVNNNYKGIIIQNGNKFILR